MGIERGGAASGAERGPGYVSRQHTHAGGPFGKNASKIHRHRGPRLRGAHGRVDFRSHLVAGLAYGRAQVNQEVLRTRAELLCEQGNPCLENACRRTPPPRMKEGNGSAHRVHQEDRDAVRYRHGREDPRRVGGVTVGIRPDDEAVDRAWVDQDPVAMYLPRMGHTREPLAPGKHDPVGLPSRVLSVPEEPKVSPGEAVASTRGTLDEPRESPGPFGMNPTDQGRGPLGNLFRTQGPVSPLGPIASIEKSDRGLGDRPGQRRWVGRWSHSPALPEGALQDPGWYRPRRFGIFIVCLPLIESRVSSLEP